MRYLAIFASAMFLASCVPIPPSTPMPNGPEVAPPPQWVEYCNRNPGDPSCYS